MSDEGQIRLDWRELRRFERTVGAFHADARREGVGPAFLRALAALVPGEAVVVSLRLRIDAMLTSPGNLAAATPDFTVEDMATHPSAARRFRKPLAVSDRISRARWHRTSCYQNCFRVLGVEDDLGIDVRLGPGGEVASACVMRPWGRFTDRDRALFRLLALHLASAHREARVIARMRELMTTGIERATTRGAIFLDPRGRVLAWSGDTRAFVAGLFGLSLKAMSRLPDELADWARRQRHAEARRPLVRESGGFRAAFHYLADDGAGAELIVVEGLPSTLATRSLSLREREVFDLAATGLRNLGIAARMNLSPGTVKRHLENIYEKLDVSGRVELMARLRSGA